MSGIAGIVNFDDAPVDAALFSRMTDFLGFRGPDARGTWIDGPVALGSTLLRTTEEAHGERQPFTFDGRTWIVADARVDGRGELVAKLKAKGCEASLDRPDVELILHAYHAWGEQCVEHLLGDFAFAIWDAVRRTLFCARDHMGVKPFYYAQAGPAVVFSNTLDCMRLHPGVSGELNDLAVADFLLFGANQEKDTTVFAAIRRIEPAHAAAWSPHGMQTRRYWTMPVDEPVHYRRLDDYTDRFKELLAEAVGDRLRTPRVGVFMSGGIDSPTLAATARDLASDVCAFTWVFDGADRERHYAGLAAKHLGIAIQFRDGAAERIDPDWERTSIHTPEPPSNPMILERDLSYHQSVAARNRVALYGEGPDAALHYEWRPYLEFLKKKRRLGRLVYDVCRHAALHRRVPLLPTIPRALKERREQAAWTGGYPGWLDPDFEARLHLRARWTEKGFQPDREHPARPVGYAAMSAPQWQAMFEELDAGVTRAPLEFRHPFFDTRLLRYLLAVPALPWCRRKYLERRAMRGTLPEEVLRRPKTALYPWPFLEYARESGLQPFEPAQGLERYIDARRVPAAPFESFSTFREGIHPRCLNYWLRNIGYLGNN